MNEEKFGSPKLYASQSGIVGFYHKIALLIAIFTLIIGIVIFLLSWIKYEYNFFIALLFGIVTAIIFYFFSSLLFAIFNVLRRRLGGQSR